MVEKKKAGANRDKGKAGKAGVGGGVGVGSGAGGGEKCCVGRPSEYREEYGEEILALMERGFSLAASAAKIGFVKQTIYSWMETHPEFMDAVERGRGLRQYFLEDKLLETKNGAEVHAAKFALACAFPEDWRERKEMEVHVKGSLAQRLEAAKAALVAGIEN